MGYPELGAVDYTNSGGRGEVQRQSPDLDLSGRVLSAYVYLDTTTAVEAEIFLQTGNTLVWASSGRVSVPPKTWTCLSVDVDNPPTITNGYDTADVRYFGVQIQRVGTGNHVYVDQFAY